MKKFLRELLRGAAIQFSDIGAVLLVANLLAAIFTYCCMDYFQPADAYLPIIALLADLIIIQASGAWQSQSDYCADPLRPDFNEVQVVIRAINFMYCLWFLIYSHDQTAASDVTIIRFSWYVTDISGLYTAIIFALKSAHHRNPKWLDGTHGHIGPANRISAIRISIAALIPHIYLAQSLGSESNLFASAILTIAIATDKLDGTVARKTNTVTRAGMALDPIGDKVLFYPVAVAFAIIFYRANDYNAANALKFIATVASAVIIIARDAIILAWFAIYGRHAHNLSATVADKIRMVILCVWLISTAYSLGFESTGFGNAMTHVSLISLITCALFSIFSLISDFHTTNLKEKF